MPSVGSLVLRFLGVFAVTLILSFFSLALAIGFLGVRAEGILPFLALLALAQLFGTISAGKLIGRTTGIVPGEIYTLRIAILTGGAALLVLALFLVQTTTSGWLGGLPALDDPQMRKSLVLGAAIFFAAAAILGRFGLIYGARLGQKRYVRTRPQVVVAEAALEIYRSPHGYSHPQASYGAQFVDALPGPGAFAMIGRLYLLVFVGSLFIVALQIWLTRAYPDLLPLSNSLTAGVLLLSCHMTGSYYGKRAGRPMTPGFAWKVAGGYFASLWLLLAALMTLTFYFGDLPTQPALPKVSDVPRGTLPIVAAMVLLMTLIITFIMKSLLLRGSRTTAPDLRRTYG